MNTVLYTTAQHENGKELICLLADAGTEINLFLLPSAPEVCNASVDPNGNLFWWGWSNDEFQRHIGLNPQLEFVEI